MAGGVCAHLDYDVDMMAKYVAEMAVRLAYGTPRVPEQFRKFISQILSSTRLPRTTILLGMNYYAKRVNLMNLHIGAKSQLSEGHVWRLLTVGLLLGSKFLDDNTFQNRSWADVSGIPVREINKMELEWMEVHEWRMYVNLDLSADYQAWLGSWNDWEANEKQQVLQAKQNREARAAAQAQQAQVQQARERLASLSLPADADYPSTHNPAVYAAWYREQVNEYNRLSTRAKRDSVGQASYRPHEAQGQWPLFGNVNASASDNNSTYAWNAGHGAPITPPDSGNTSPNYDCSSTSNKLPSPEWYHSAQHTYGAHAGNGQHGYSGYNKYAGSRSRYAGKMPGYNNFYSSNIWEHRGDTNSNANCYPNMHGHSQGMQYFGMGHQQYGQPVMG